jgi:hypothetical protein
VAVEGFEDRASALVALLAAGRGQTPKNLLHAEEHGDLRLDLCDLGLSPPLHVVTRPPGASQREQLPDLAEGEPEFLGPLDEVEAVHRLLVILSVAGRPAGRFFEQPVLLVETHRLDTDPGLPGYLSDRHRLHVVRPLAAL